jgi:hypothetical protein
MQEVQDRNQKNYSAYLSTLNTKGSTNYRAGLFRDTIIATEYDPMATRSQYIKVRVLHCCCILPRPRALLSRPGGVEDQGLMGPREHRRVRVGTRLPCERLSFRRSRVRPVPV